MVADPSESLQKGARTDADAPRDTCQDRQPIILKVLWDNGIDKQTVSFKLKMSTSLGKLIKAWCERMGVTESQVRFMVNGERVTADNTAERLHLVDGDTIGCAT
mmetsp:Transcript_6614/g.15166  ORF Transcript_6614/g.15166 Transcript_6614/m.15166 type:complete len:104 (+) Transcript_6614:39-350(+)